MDFLRFFNFGIFGENKNATLSDLCYLIRTKKCSNSNIINKITPKIWDEVDNEGNTLLLYCCKFNYKDYIYLILEKYGDLCKPNNINESGTTSLMYLISEKNEMLANKLLDLEATWLTISYNVNAALMLSIIYKLHSIFIRIANKVNLNIINSNGENIFYMTIILYSNDKSYKYFLDMLLDMDIKVNQKTTSGKTALSYANILPEDIIQKILEKQNKYEDKPQLEIFKKSNFLIPEKYLDNGSYGQIYSVFEWNSGTILILKKYFGYNNCSMINSDFVKELTYITMLNNLKIKGLCLENDDLYLVLQPLDLKISEYCNIIVKLFNRENYILKLIEGLIRAVYDIHCMGICHNDLKVSNIMFDNGKIYVIDFGISTLMGIASKNLEYISTDCIKAPDSGEKKSYELKDTLITIPKNRYSYHSDVYSLGVTILNLIFEDTENYICIDNIIYRNILYTRSENFIEKNKFGKLIELNETEIKKINSYGDYIYELVKRMINSKAIDRIKLHDLLFTPKIPIKTKISDYLNLNINKVHNAFTSKIIRYSSDDIKNWTNGIEYYEEIHQSHVNDSSTIENLTLYENPKHISLKILTDWIIQVIISIELSFDCLINSILILRKSMNNLRKSKFQLQACIAILFCNDITDESNIILNEDFFVKYTCSVYSKSKIKETFNNFIIENFTYIPVNLHIQYIVIKMRTFEFESKIISEFEWYAMRLLVKYLIDIENCNICYWDFIVQLALNFAKNNNLDFSIFISDNITDRYNFKEIEESICVDELVFLSLLN